MREGWEYKKLEDCAEIEYGTRVVQKRDGGTIYPVYGGGGETFKMDTFNREDCLIVARFAMSKCCVRYVSGKFFLNDSGLSVKAGGELYQDYLNHNIMFLNDDIYNLGKGAAQRNLDVKAFKLLKIAIPPKSVQLEIVSELDQINELIRLKKEQLKDYDNLAQSIFYAMFGDPVENDKGWEVTRFSEVFNVTSSKRIYLQELVNEGVPFLKVSDIVSMVDGKEAVPKSFIKESLFDDLQSRGLVPRKGDLLITARGTLGKCYIMKETDRFYFQDGMVTWLQKKVELESLFVKYVFCDNSFRVYLNRNAKHTTVDYISIQHLGNMKIPLPPLPLQQEFSSRISQIERQKAEVSNAIADLETLLASRMQYWFE